MVEMFQDPPDQKVKRNKTKKLWKLLSITNYTTLIRPLACVAFIMGFLPYKIESSKFVSSRSYFIYSTIVTIVYMVFVVYSIYEINFIGLEVMDVSGYIHCNIIMILGPLSLIFAYVSNRSAVRVLQRVSELSRILSPSNFSNLAKWFYTKSTIMMIPLLLYIPRLTNVFASISLYTFLGILVLNNLYTYNVMVLKACFQQINKSLVQVREILINDQPHLLRRVYHTQENPTLLIKLRNLKKQHYEISQVVQILNDVFGRQNLTIITILFISVTYNLYIYLVLCTEKGRIKQWFFFIIMYIAYHTVHLILIVWAAESAKSQLPKIGTNIHRILIHTFDKEVTSELEMFSLQVLQTDNTFSARGLIIDATLLTKVLSSIATYLLILIQMLLVKPC